MGLPATKIIEDVERLVGVWCDRRALRAWLAPSTRNAAAAK